MCELKARLFIEPEILPDVQRFLFARPDCEENRMNADKALPFRVIIFTVCLFLKTN